MLIDSTAALRAFRLIAAHGSFTRAAAVSQVTASALSQSLRQLESQLGVRLLQRTTRSVGLTEAGRALLTRITPALAELDAALEETRQDADTPRGILRLTMPQAVLPSLIAPLLADFAAAWPQVQLEVSVDNGLSDVVGEGFDAGIRLGERLQHGMIAVPISGPLRSVVAGSPAYFKQHGRPRHPRELQQHRCVQFRYSSGGGVYRWEFAERGPRGKARWFETDVSGPLIVNDNALAVRAARDGAGLVHLLEPFVREELASGHLESVLEAWLPAYDGFYLYFPSRLQIPPKLRVFIDFLRQRAGLGVLPSA